MRVHLWRRDAAAYELSALFRGGWCVVAASNGQPRPPWLPRLTAALDPALALGRPATAKANPQFHSAYLFILLGAADPEEG